MRKPLKAGTIIEWDGIQATVIKEIDDGILVNCDDEQMLWDWWCDGIECKVVTEITD